MGAADAQRRQPRVAALSEVERASNEQIYREFVGANSQSAAAAAAAAAAQGSSSSAGAATSSSGGVGPDERVCAECQRPIPDGCTLLRECRRHGSAPATAMVCPECAVAKDRADDARIRALLHELVVGSDEEAEASGDDQSYGENHSEAEDGDGAADGDDAAERPVDWASRLADLPTDMEVDIPMDE